MAVRGVWELLGGGGGRGVGLTSQLPLRAGVTLLRPPGLRAGPLTSPKATALLGPQRKLGASRSVQSVFIIIQKTNTRNAIAGWCRRGGGSEGVVRARAPEFGNK